MHRADYDQVTGLDAFTDHRAPVHDVLDGLGHVLVSHRLHVRLVRRRSLALDVVHGVERRGEVRQRRGQVAQLDVIAGALDGAALGVTEHHNHLRARHSRRELEAAEKVGVDKVASHARREHVPDALVEDDLVGHAAVNAAQDGRHRVLSIGRVADLAEEVTLQRLAIEESLVAVFQQLDDAIGRELGLGLGGEGGGQISVSGGGHNGNRGQGKESRQNVRTGEGRPPAREG